MRFPILGLGLLLCFTAAAKDERIPVVRGENARFAIEAKLYKNPDQIPRILGRKLEKGIVVVAVTLTPKGDKPFEVWRDDFILRSDKDGEKSEPYDPGQIAGSTVLTVIYTTDGGGAHAENNGPVWGGVGGMPRRLPGTASGIGNAGTVERASGATLSKGGKKVNPLLQTLRKRILPDGKITAPVSGLLYYPLEGKHKVKQIWLHYVGDEGGKIDLRFRKPK